MSEIKVQAEKLLMELPKSVKPDDTERIITEFSALFRARSIMQQQLNDDRERARRFRECPGFRFKGKTYRPLPILLRREEQVEYSTSIRDRKKVMLGSTRMIVAVNHIATFFSVESEKQLSQVVFPEEWRRMCFIFPGEESKTIKTYYWGDIRHYFYRYCAYFQSGWQMRKIESREIGGLYEEYRPEFLKSQYYFLAHVERVKK